MRDDNNKYLLSIIAALASIPLVLIYWLLPAGPNSSRFHLLLIDCIPDTLVVLLAVVITYWLFYRRGLISMGDCPLAAAPTSDHPPGRDDATMQFIPEEVIKAASDDKEVTNEQEVLIVVDIQQDFISGALRAHDAPKILRPLNAAISMAQSKGMLVVFTKDWHPINHWSFKTNGGPWEPHCIMNTDGAKLSPDLKVPTSGVVLEFGVEPGTLGYSPLENPALDLIISNPRVQTVYVAGIALEYCVQATCRAICQRGKKIVAMENVIATASDNVEENEKVWTELVGMGVIRAKHHTVMGA